MKLWPTRTKNQTALPIADLDAIVAEPVRFRYKGKIHELKPMSLEHFLKFTNAQAELLSAMNDEASLSAQSLAERYLSVIASVCDSITIEDILEMEQVQVAALYQLVIDLVTGQVQTGEDVKKKRTKIDIYESVRPLSLQNVGASSDGPSESH